MVMSRLRNFVREEDWTFAPHERPALPGSPGSPEHPTATRWAYGVIAVLLGLTAGFGNALIAANTTTLQGALGLDPAQIAWLPTVYVMTNVSINLLLIKFRQQFGLRPFAIIFLAVYALLTFAHLFVLDFSSAIVVRAASGMAGAPVSSLCLYYMMQALPAKWRLKAVVVGIGIPQCATPLARLFSPELLAMSQWRTLYLFELGLALVSLAAVAWLRLPPTTRQKAFEPLDFVTFVLFAGSMGCSPRCWASGGSCGGRTRRGSAGRCWQRSRCWRRRSPSSMAGPIPCSTPAGWRVPTSCASPSSRSWRASCCPNKAMPRSGC